MNVNGTLMNYYIHCPRQCYLFGNRINMEDNSEAVKIGRAIHEEKAQKKDTEIAIDNIKIDKIGKEFLVEVKKSDADIEACKWQVLLYLKILKNKGIIRKGKLEFVEKRQKNKKTVIVELTDELESILDNNIKAIEDLLACEKIPPVLNKASCKKCAYYDFCYI